jgi:hypothetical protein
MKNLLSLILAASFALVVNAQQQMVQVACPAGTLAGCICMQKMQVATPVAAMPARQLRPRAPTMSTEEKQLVESMSAMMRQMTLLLAGGSNPSSVISPSAPASVVPNSSSTIYTVEKKTWDDMAARLSRLETRQNELAAAQNAQGERIVAVEQTANNALAEAQRAAAAGQSLKSLIGTRGTRSEKKAIKTWDSQ